MTKPNTLKEILENKINKEKIYNSIINKTTYQENNNLSLRKPILIISSIILVFTLIYIYNTNNKVLEKSSLYEYNHPSRNNVYSASSNITKEKISLDSIDIMSNNSNVNTNSSIEQIDNWQIPSELNKIESYAIYTNNNNAKILHEYNIIYSNNQDKSISISFSNQYQPFNNYELDDNYQLINIKSIDIKIYSKDNIYIIPLTNNNYNYLITMNNISYSEVISFISSLLGGN